MLRIFSGLMFLLTSVSANASVVEDNIKDSTHSTTHEFRALCAQITRSGPVTPYSGSTKTTEIPLDLIYKVAKIAATNQPPDLRKCERY